MSQGRASVQCCVGKVGELRSQLSCTFTLFTRRKKGILRNTWAKPAELVHTPCSQPSCPPAPLGAGAWQ